MTVVWLAIGGAVVDGILTETPGVARRPIEVSITGSAVTLGTDASLGPFAAAAGPFAAFGLFGAANGGTMSFSVAFTPIGVEAGEFLSFPAGDYAMTPAGAPGGDVLTIGGIPLTAGGQPLQVN